MTELDFTPGITRFFSRPKRPSQLQIVVSPDRVACVIGDLVGGVFEATHRGGE
jgi:hypothetical protein